MISSYKTRTGKEIHADITERIVKELEKGCIPWKKPWSITPPQNITTKKAYSGINAILLHLMPYKSPYYLTFNQCKTLGGNIKEGEHSTRIIYYTPVETIEKDTNGKTIITKEGTPKTITYGLLKEYGVFNIEQTTGIETPPVKEKLDFEPIEKAEKIIAKYMEKTKISYQSGNTKAGYTPALDIIIMPNKENFKTTSGYYTTLFHEMSHSTGHKTRLNREGIQNINFGSDIYRKEELIAELGASYLSGITQIEHETLENSAAYIENWIKTIKADHKIIPAAAAAAQKSTNYITEVI